MSFNKKRNATLCVVCCIFLLSSCLKDNFDFDKFGKANWSPEFALPLINSSLSLQDLLIKTTDEQKDYYIVDDDNFITLVYNGELFSVTAEEVMKIPQQSFNFGIQAGQNIPSLPNGNSISIPGSQVIPFNSGTGNQVDSIRLKKATFQLTLTSTFQHSIEIILTIPTATKNGNPFSQVIQLNYTGSTPVVNTVTVDLTDYVFDLTNGNGSTNEFTINYAVTVSGSGQPVNSTDELTIDGSITAIEFKSMFGALDLGTFTSDKDTVTLTIFDAAAGNIGAFKLAKPKIKLTFNSSFGLPLAVSFPTLLGINTVSGINQDISNNSDIPNPFVLPAPKINEIGNYAVDSIVLTSSIVNFINDKPRLFIYQIEATSATLTGQKSFILDTSRIVVNADLELPLEGIAKDFTVTDTIPADIEGVEEISEMGIRIRIRNGFPLDVYTQIYMVDSLYNVLDSLLPTTDAFMASAPVGNNGKAITFTEKTTDVSLSSEKIKKLSSTANFIIKGRATTFDNGTKNVKIYADYKLDIKAGITVKTSLNF